MGFGRFRRHNRPETVHGIQAHTKVLPVVEIPLVKNVFTEPAKITAEPLPEKDAKRRKKDITALKKSIGEA